MRGTSGGTPRRRRWSSNACWPTARRWTCGRRWRRRIQAVNDTPLITVIDRAVPPEKRSSPKRKLNVVLAFFLGGMLGVFGAFGREFVERARERDEEEFEEFTSRLAAMKAGLRSLLPGARRARQRG